MGQLILKFWYYLTKCIDLKLKNRPIRAYLWCKLVASIYICKYAKKPFIDFKCPASVPNK